jgi:coenzyme PQQ precursor peptide PqqA
MKPWEKPAFEELSVSAECTGYAGVREGPSASEVEESISR